MGTMMMGLNRPKKPKPRKLPNKNPTRKKKRPCGFPISPRSLACFVAKDFGCLPGGITAESVENLCVESAVRRGFRYHFLTVWRGPAIVAWAWRSGRNKKQPKKVKKS